MPEQDTKTAETEDKTNVAPKPPRRFKETEKRTLHRYHMICKELGYNAKDFDGVPPDESLQMIQSAIEEMKAKRTDEEVIFNKGDKVTLAGKVYEIKPLSIDEDLAWREKCGEIANEIIDVLIEFASKDKKDQPQAERNQAMLRGLVPYVMGKGLNKVTELLFLYSPELTADEEKIRKEASSAEVVAGAMKALNVAFPFVESIVSGGLAVVTQAKGSSTFKGMLD